MLEINGLKGYCKIKPNNSAFLGISEEIIGKQKYQELQDRVNNSLFMPILDIGVGNSGLLCYEPQGTCLVDIRDMNDVESYFTCEVFMDVIIPTGLSLVDKISYVTKRLARRGGYNSLIRRLVILNSLRSGKVNDDFLFD